MLAIPQIQDLLRNARIYRPTKQDKSIRKKSLYRQKLTGTIWKSEARKVIESKLKHYEETGNENKAAIYRAKLSVY